FVAYTETMASMYRKKREADLEGILIRETVDSFQKDWITFIRVEENDELSGYMTQVIKKHPLRGFDEIHLASAMMIHENLPDHFLFACFDERLNYAARSEGLGTFPP
ncbi:MAG: type II toxin-antitoxin system VapC family toxin, partial [Deltaproteobacteria bacterium]|nr:type II toxin-antitoxin system VapC family toxin [Deltaproteobacteria bacterium]